MNDTPQPIRVFSYIRESTQEQLLRGYRPGYQRRAIARYCEKNNFIIEEEFVDGQSGSRSDRKDFSRMIETIKKRNDIRFIVVEEISRFSRDYLYCLNLEEQLQKENNVYAIDTVNDLNPRAYLTGKIDPNIAESRRAARSRSKYESELTSTRRTQQNEEKRNDHSHPGTLPYAVRWCDGQATKRFIEYDPTKISIVKLIFSLYTNNPGIGFHSLANELNARGYIYTKPKKGVDETDGTLKTVAEVLPFSKDLVRSVLTSTAYIGLQNFSKGLRYKTVVDGEIKDLEPIISKHDWDLAQSQIDKNTKGTSSKIKRNSRQKPGRTYLLQGIGRSAVNGSKLYGQAEPRKDGTEVRRYIPKENRTKEGQPVGTVRADEVELEILRFLRATRLNDVETVELALRNLIAQSVQAKRGRNKAELTAWDKSEAKSLDEMIKSLKKTMEDDPSSYSTIRPTLEIYLKKKHDLETAAFLPSVDYFDFRDIADFAKNTVESVRKLKSLAAQQHIVQIMFDEVFVHKVSEASLQALKEEGYAPLDQAKVLKELLQEYCPKLFDRVYVETTDETVSVAIEPSGLFVLLADTDVAEYTSPDSGFSTIVLKQDESKKKTLLSLSA